MKAIDFVLAMRQALAALPEHAPVAAAMSFISEAVDAMDKYNRAQEQDRIELAQMKEEHHKDARIQELSHKYGMTTNQVFGFMDACDQLNNGELNSTGMVVVPFWFHEQYLEQKRLVEALTNESATLTETVQRLSGESTEDLSGYLPERKSIVTGVQQPYIPGVTGPRVGHEHMDPENLYPGK